MNEIKALREATGLTQRAFSELLGIPKRSAENGLTVVSTHPGTLAAVVRVETGK